MYYFQCFRSCDHYYCCYLSFSRPCLLLYSWSEAQCFTPLCLSLFLFLHSVRTQSFFYACTLTNGPCRCSPRCLSTTAWAEPLKTLASAPQLMPPPLHPPPGRGLTSKTWATQRLRSWCAHCQPPRTYRHTLHIYKASKLRLFTSSAVVASASGVGRIGLVRLFTLVLWQITQRTTHKHTHTQHIQCLIAWHKRER